MGLINRPQSSSMRSKDLGVGFSLSSLPGSHLEVVIAAISNSQTGKEQLKLWPVVLQRPGQTGDMTGSGLLTLYPKQRRDL